MKPSTFLELALPHEGKREQTASALIDLMDEGYALGIPWFNINIDVLKSGKGYAKIKGHEGRARMIAIQKKIGDRAVPVHFILTGGARARDLTPELIEGVKSGIEAEGSSNVIKHPLEAMFVNSSKV